MNTTKKISIILATTIASCVTYAKRDYDQYPEHKKEIALYNIQNILEDICIKSSADQNKIRCDQCCFNGIIHEGRCVPNIIADYSWNEIKEVKCLGRSVEIKGKYDTTTIFTKGPIWDEHLRQCDELTEAFNIYLGKK